MIDLKKHEYEEMEYQQFLNYIQATWGALLFDGDFKDEVTIKKVILSSYNNTFNVFVYLNDCTYYDIKNDELIEVKYDGKAIKTSYTLNSQDILYMLMKGDLLEELGLNDTEIIINDFTDGLEINQDLTKELEEHEQSWAETQYCIEHDL